MIFLLVSDNLEQVFYTDPREVAKESGWDVAAGVTNPVLLSKTMWY